MSIWRSLKKMKLIKFSGNIIIVITGTTAPIVKISEKEAKKI